jgi:hypothetical protein
MTVGYNQYVILFQFKYLLIINPVKVLDSFFKNWILLHSLYTFSSQGLIPLKDLIENPDCVTKKTEINVRILHIGPLKENKTSRGLQVMRAQVILADRSSFLSSLFTSKVLSIAEKAFEKDKSLRYIWNFIVIWCATYWFCNFRI